MKRRIVSIASPHGLLIVSVVIALCGFGLAMLLPPCRGADPSFRYECWTDTIEALINGWGVLTVLGVTMSSVAYVGNRVKKRNWSVPLGLFYTFTIYASALTAHVAIGAAANTIGERHGAHIFYGDSGMGAAIIFFLEALWCAIIWAIGLILSLVSVWRGTR